MKVEEICSTVDHTLLAQTATWEEIKVLCDDAITYGAASVCIPPCFVSKVKEYAAGRMKICTVIGFPNGYQTTNVKEFEAGDAIQQGADEIDMVINIGAVKEGNYEMVRQEICLLKEICHDRILKVIIETCLLTREEIIKMCEIVTAAGADFIKTSTGFAASGANFLDVELMVKNVGKNVKVKAAGGIQSLEDAERFLSLGASRLGTSRVIKLVKEGKDSGSGSAY